MPRTSIDYTNTHFYKIVCKDTSITDCYVGHTTDFKTRRYGHKQKCNDVNSKAYNFEVYTFIRNHGGWENFDMVLVETQMCVNALDAYRVERIHIERLKAMLNMRLPSRTSKEYYEDRKEHIKLRCRNYYYTHTEEKKQYSAEYREHHKDHLREQRKIYVEQHKEQIRTRMKQYHELNKNKLSNIKKDYYATVKETLLERTICECGKPTSKKNRATHEKSKYHQQYASSITQKIELV